ETSPSVGGIPGCCIRIRVGGPGCNSVPYLCPDTVRVFGGRSVRRTLAKFFRNSAGVSVCICQRRYVHSNAPKKHRTASTTRLTITRAEAPSISAIAHVIAPRSTTVKAVVNNGGRPVLYGSCDAIISWLLAAVPHPCRERAWGLVWAWFVLC